jgi:hypothetical protein
MRAYVVTDQTGAIVGFTPVGTQETKRDPESEDIMEVEIFPVASRGQSVHEVELPPRSRESSRRTSSSEYWSSPRGGR